jgi:hypothetical protein
VARFIALEDHRLLPADSSPWAAKLVADCCRPKTDCRKENIKKSDWKDIAELIGIAAIVASLLFVGLQMKQSQEIAIAAQYHDRADNQILQPVKKNQVKAFPAPLEHAIHGYRVEQDQESDKNRFVNGEFHTGIVKNETYAVGAALAANICLSLQVIRG